MANALVEVGRIQEGSVSVSIAGGAGDQTALAADYAYGVILLTGVLTGARNYILPLTVGGRWRITNNTTGDFVLTVKGATGTGVAIARGQTEEVYADGTNFVRYRSNLVASATWDPASIPDGDDLSTTIAVPGAAIGDPVVAGFPIGANNVLMSAHVSAVDVVTVVLLNRTGGALDLASGTLRVCVLKP